MKPRMTITVSGSGEILVRPEGEEEWCVFNHAMSLSVAHHVIAGQTPFERDPEPGEAVPHG